MSQFTINTVEIMGEMTKRIKQEIHFDQLSEPMQDAIEQEVIHPIYKQLQAVDPGEQKQLIINEIVDNAMANLSSQLSIFNIITQYENNGGL